MAEPTQFFSTIIQASAGFLSIIVAVGTVIYSLEIRFREPRTKDLYEFLTDMSEKYRMPFEESFKAIEETVDADYSNQFATDACFYSTDPLQEALNSDSEVAKVSARLYRISNNFSNERLRTFHSITDEQVAQIEEDLRWLMENFVYEDGSKAFYREITDLDEDEELPEDYTEKRILGSIQHISSVNTWFINKGDNDSAYDGSTISSLSQLFARANTRVNRSLPRLREESIIDYESPLRRILVLTGLSAIVGILVPALFLLTLPTTFYSLTSWQIFYVEVSVLALESLFVGALLYTLFSSLR